MEPDPGAAGADAVRGHPGPRGLRRDRGRRRAHVRAGSCCVQRIHEHNLPEEAFQLVHRPAQVRQRAPRRVRHGHRARGHLDLRPRAPAGDDRLPAHAVPDLPVVAGGAAPHPQTAASRMNRSAASVVGTVMTHGDLVAYVSGHGSGIRTDGDRARRLRALDPGLPIAVVTAGPEWLFRQAVGPGLVFRAERVRRRPRPAGRARHRHAATVAACAAFAREMPARVEHEAAWLRERGGRLVLGDIPPLAFRGRGKAGVPAIGMSQLLVGLDLPPPRAPASPRLAAAAAAAARRLRARARLLQLPFAATCPPSPAGRRCRSSRAGRASRARKARRRLGLGPAPAVLLSSAAWAFPASSSPCWSTLRSFQFLSEPTRLRARPPTCASSPRPTSPRTASTYLDLVAAADVVVTKPGYGIVTDAIACRTRMVYTERAISRVPDPGGGDGALAARRVRLERRPARRAPAARPWRPCWRRPFPSRRPWTAAARRGARPGRGRGALSSRRTPASRCGRDRARLVLPPPASGASNTGCRIRWRRPDEERTTDKALRMLSDHTLGPRASSSIRASRNTWPRPPWRSTTA